MTKLTKVRSSRFKDQVFVGDPSFRAPRSSLLVLPVWGNPSWAGRPQISATCQRVLPPASCTCSWLRAAPVLLLWRQEVRTVSELLLGFRLPRAILPRDVLLEPWGLAEFCGPSATQCRSQEAALLFGQPPRGTWRLGKKGP